MCWLRAWSHKAWCASPSTATTRAKWRATRWAGASARSSRVRPATSGCSRTAMAAACCGSDRPRKRTDSVRVLVLVELVRARIESGVEGLGGLQGLEQRIVVELAIRHAPRDGIGLER